jgi:hypothetical protein
VVERATRELLMGGARSAVPLSHLGGGLSER